MLRHATILAVVLLMFAACLANAQQTARGYVFNDKDANGIRDEGEKGVKNVIVSNGRDIVKTDRTGAWSLPVDNDDVLFVVKPTGWKTPVGPGMAPKFYYIHKPDGSPKSYKFPGVEPTGPLPASIDFPLQRAKEPKEFKVAVFGDSQVEYPEQIGYLQRDFIDGLIGTDAAFGTTLGDNVDNTLNLFPNVMNAVSAVGIPWHYVPGNHDMNQDSPDDAHAYETFQRYFGPSYYAFEYSNVHFVVLDTPYWQGKDYIGKLDGEQISFVKNYLFTVPRNRLVVLLMHIPLFSISNARLLYDMLDAHPNAFAMAAHTHTISQHFLNKQGSGPLSTGGLHLLVAGATCGCWYSGVPDEYGVPHATTADGAPNGHFMVTFKDTDYSFEFIPARRPREYQINVQMPATLEKDAVKGTELTANVFAGNTKSKVEMRVDETGDWIPMKQVYRPDPAHVEMKTFEENFKGTDGKLPQFIKGSMSKSDKCHHLWVGEVPTSLSSGVHHVSVRTVDMFGKEYISHRPFDVK